MKYFKTDGIRGKAYQEVSLSLAYKLGVALNEICDELVIGMDPRISSIDLAQALVSGYNKKYQFAGVIPTPGLMYYSLKKNIMAVMITASHNPYYDNGFKIIEKGHKLGKNNQIIIENIIENMEDVYTEKKLELKVDESIKKTYLDFVKTHFYLPTKKVIFDGANGCFSDILKTIYEQKLLINCNPNGYNINENCGSTNLSNLIQKVKESNSDYGIAFDGDGDRVLLVDKNNRIYNADFLIYLLAIKLKKENKLIGSTVVFSEVSNPGIINKLNSQGINTIVTAVGDSNISKALASGYVLGGEPSGHIINLNNLPFGDGLINSFDILQIIDHINLLEEYQSINFFYEQKENINLKPKEYLNLEKVKKVISKNSNNNQIVLVRESGTEKVIRVTMFQKQKHSFEKNFNKVLEKVRKCIKHH